MYIERPIHLRANLHANVSTFQSRPAFGHTREPSESHSGVGDEGPNAGPTKRDCRERHAARHSGGTTTG